MGVFDRKVLTVAACIICTAWVLGVFLAFPIWAPAWTGEFHMKLGVVMTVFAASGLLMNVVMPVIGRLLLRIPAWRMVLLGGVLLGGGLILATFVRVPAAFCVLYAIIMGLGVAMAGILPCQALAVSLFPNRVGSIGGMMMVALAVTGVIFPVTLLPLKAAFGWRPALAVLAAVTLVVVPLLAIVFMRGAAEPGSAAGAHGAHGAGGSSGAGPIVSTGAFWVMVAGILPMLLTASAIQANITSILADRGVLSASSMSFAMSALAVGTAIGAGMFGWLADRIDPRIAVIAVAGLMAVCFLILVKGSGLALAATGAATLGLGSGGITPIMSTFALRRYGAGYAPAFGLLNFFMLPYMLGAPLFGFVHDRTGSYNLILLIAAPVIVIGAIGMWSLKSVKSPPSGAEPLADGPLETEGARQLQG